MRIGHEGIRPYVEAVWGWDQAEQESRFRDGFDEQTIRIVRVDGEDAGYLKIESREDHVFIAGIYLDGRFRDRGIGREIILDVLRSASEAGNPVRLQVLRPNPAQRLYARLGFSVVGTTETHIHMEHRGAA